MLEGRRLELWMRQHESSHPHAVAYLRLEASTWQARVYFERLADRYQDLFWDTFDRTVLCIGELYPKYSRSRLRRGDLQKIFESLRRRVGQLPHDGKFEAFEEVLEAFYAQPSYPLLEHLVYLTPIGLERLRIVLDLAGLGAPSPARIADLGVGPGAVLAALLKAYPGAVGAGFDVSNPCVRYSRDALSLLGFKAERFSIRRADARALPSQPSPFDLIIATEIIEHVPDPHRLLEEAHRHLRDDGRLVVSAPLRLPWGPHLSVFESTEEVQRLYTSRFEIEDFRVIPFDGTASMTFASLRRKS